MSDIRVEIPPVAECDVVIDFPGGRQWTLQYRKYEGVPTNCDCASVDLLLDRVRPVNTWTDGMVPARAVADQPHVRKADQLCIIL